MKDSYFLIVKGTAADAEREISERFDGNDADIQSMEHHKIGGITSVYIGYIAGHVWSASGDKLTSWLCEGGTAPFKPGSLLWYKEIHEHGTKVNSS